MTIWSQRRWYKVWGGLEGDKCRAPRGISWCGYYSWNVREGRRDNFRWDSRALMAAEILTVRKWSWDRQKDGWTQNLSRDHVIRKDQVPVTACECLCEEKHPASWKKLQLTGTLLLDTGDMGGTRNLKQPKLIFPYHNLMFLNLPFLHIWSAG